MFAKNALLIIACVQSPVKHFKSILIFALAFSANCYIYVQQCARMSRTAPRGVRITFTLEAMSHRQSSYRLYYRVTIGDVRKMQPV